MPLDDDPRWPWTYYAVVGDPATIDRWARQYRHLAADEELIRITEPEHWQQLRRLPAGSWALIDGAFTQDTQDRLIAPHASDRAITDARERDAILSYRPICTDCGGPRHRDATRPKLDDGLPRCTPCTHTEALVGG